MHATILVNAFVYEPISAKRIPARYGFPGSECLRKGKRQPEAMLAKQYWLGSMTRVSAAVYRSLPDRRPTSKKCTTTFGWSVLWIMIWAISIWRLECSNRSKIHSVQKCYLCLRYVVSPMSPGRTHERWSREWELNPRPADYESAALPLSYLGPCIDNSIRGKFLQFKGGNCVPSTREGIHGPADTYAD